jgi:hypothetical protein
LRIDRRTVANRDPRIVGERFDQVHCYRASVCG